jgi:cobalt-zinc-cadmium efflux system protein
MSHSHSHNHNQTHQKHGKAFAIGIGLNLIFVAVEVFYGFAANSSALMADAGHNASDVLSLVFAWTAAWLATRKPKGKYTYGLRRTTILVSILNALLLFGAMFMIGWDALDKFKHPQPVGGTQVMIVAGIGVIINTITALLFMKGQKEDLNIRGAFLHMAADAAVSVGVVVAGLLIILTGNQWIDPAISLFIILIILFSTWRLFIDSIDLALDAVPKNIDVEEVFSFLKSREGVSDVHDLHIWAISTAQVALTAHLIMPQGGNDDFLSSLQHDLEHEFNIGHTTFQIEVSTIDNHCTTQC